MTIKLADVIDNVRSISEEDPRFGRIYVAEKEALLEVLEQGDARLLKRATVPDRADSTDARRA